MKIIMIGVTTTGGTIFWFWVLVFKTGFLCEIVLSVLELTLEQAGLSLPSAGIKVCPATAWPVRDW